MILTQCAVCATELGLSLGKKCGRCSTRYCGPECQVQHWKEGGHDKLCKLIKKAGGAEQYNANEKYADAVAVAAKACAADTKGQTCYICTQALHWKTKEGLVRMCACRGTAGFAHVSCLAEEAKTLFAEVEENNLGDKVRIARWQRWHTCGLCEQDYHGVVYHALGWACWKTYVGRPETNWARIDAMNQLGNGLSAADHDEDALNVGEAELSMRRRVGDSESNILAMQLNLAITYSDLGRYEHALRLKRDVYSGRVKLHGEEHEDTHVAAFNYASSLIYNERFEEARTLLRRTVPMARRVLGEGNRLSLMMRWKYGEAICRADGAALDDIREGVNMLEETARTARRVLGGANPTAAQIEHCLRCARATLRARETGDMSDVNAICEGVEAMTRGDAK